MLDHIDQIYRDIAQLEHNSAAMEEPASTDQPTSLKFLQLHDAFKRMVAVGVDVVDEQVGWVQHKGACSTAVDNSGAGELSLRVPRGAAVGCALSR